MARGRAAWKKVYDVKPHLSRLFRWMETEHPSITSALRYHSLGSPIEKGEIFEELERPHFYMNGAYADAYRIVSINNVDGINPAGIRAVQRSQLTVS
jgi:hypothetical protein